jgi:PAS domain S-box-containing protein
MILADTTNTERGGRAEALAAVGAFLEARRQALAASAAVSPGALVLDDASRAPLMERAVDAFIERLGDPVASAAWVSALLSDGIASGLTDMQTHALLDAVHQPLLDAALDALGEGLPHAREGVHALLEQRNWVHQAVTRFLQQGRDVEMRRMATRLEQSLATTPLATIEWDWNGTILRWNAAAQRIFGWNAEEAVGKNIVALLVPDVDLQRAQQISRGVLNDASSVSLRHNNLHKDGRLLTCQWYNAVLSDEAGQVVGAISQIEDVTEEIRAEETLRASQEQLIMAQQAALRELSTPLIPLDDGVVAMPLIGAIDSTRAQQVIETLLEGVSGHHARVAILDITGVSVVDTQVANALIRAAQAVKLLGARVVLTGIRPEVAQTLVGLGVDLNGIVTRSSLQAGIQYALGR